MVSHVLLKGFNYIVGIVRGRENTPTTLALGFHTITPQKGEQIIAEKTVEGAIEKTAIGAVHGDKLIQFFSVGQVATCLATNEYFAARTRGLLQQNDVGT
jgi:hypothetical protein